MTTNGRGEGIPSLNNDWGDDDASGLFNLPTLYPGVNKLIRDQGCVDALARHIPMPQLTMILRKFATGVGAFWVDAMAVKTKDAPSFEPYFLRAEKIAVIVPFEDQLLEDMDTDLVALVKDDVSGAFVETLDRTYMGYEISSPFGDSLSGNTPLDHIVPYGTDVDIVGDISEAISTVEMHGFDITGMITHKRLKHYLRNLRDKNIQPIFTQDLAACNPRERYCVLGIPICFTNQVAADDSPAGYEILMAYFDYVIIGDRTGLEVYMSREATLTQGSAEPINMFEQDMTAYRFVMRKGFVIKDDNVLAKVTGVPV